MKTITDFDDYYMDLGEKLKDAPVVETKRWQSTDQLEHALRMKELTHVDFVYKVPQTIDKLAKDVRPYLPWANEHFFTERVSGQPINPGETYKRWRYPASAAQHTDFQFSHSYAERYWPKHAGQTPGGKLDAGELFTHTGIRNYYGDLEDLVHLLVEDPHSRQAYLPIFFPEDLTAARKKERIPCTLGYHFLMREGELDIYYPMRSCDYVRHFQDDVYLTVMLLYFVRGEAMRIAKETKAESASTWEQIKPGRLRMHISSLHCFATDL